MRSTYTTKKRGRLVQVEWKWCGKLSRENLKHKLYMACNLWDIVVTYEIRIFFEGAQKEVFSSIFKKTL